jgi:hypothetical protein
MPDSLGNILFYTNGCYVANVQGDTMANGAGLNPGEMADLRLARPVAMQLRLGRWLFNCRGIRTCTISFTWGSGTIRKRS